MHLGSLVLEPAGLTNPMEDFERVQSILDESFAIAPRGSGPLMLAARFNFSVHRLDQMDRRALQKREEQLAGRVHRAGIALQRGHYDAAREGLTAAAAAMPAAAGIEFALYHAQTGNPGEAHAHLEDALASTSAKDPQRHAWIQLQLGLDPQQLQRHAVASKFAMDPLEVDLHPLERKVAAGRGKELGLEVPRHHAQGLGRGRGRRRQATTFVSTNAPNSETSGYDNHGPLCPTYPRALAIGALPSMLTLWWLWRRHSSRQPIFALLGFFMLTHPLSMLAGDVLATLDAAMVAGLGLGLLLVVLTLRARARRSPVETGPYTATSEDLPTLAP